MTFAPDPRKAPGAKDIVAKFKTQGYDPEGYTLYSYAAIQVWAAAVEATKSLDTAKLSPAIRGKTFKTADRRPASTTTRATSRTPQYVFFVWKNGQYAETAM